MILGNLEPSEQILKKEKVWSSKRKKKKLVLTGLLFGLFCECLFFTIRKTKFETQNNPSKC